MFVNSYYLITSITSPAFFIFIHDYWRKQVSIVVLKERRDKTKQQNNYRHLSLNFKGQIKIFREEVVGDGYSSVVEHLPSMCKKNPALVFQHHKRKRGSFWFFVFSGRVCWVFCLRPMCCLEVL